MRGGFHFVPSMAGGRDRWIWCGIFLLEQGVVNDLCSGKDKPSSSEGCKHCLLCQEKVVLQLSLAAAALRWCQGWSVRSRCLRSLHKAQQIQQPVLQSCSSTMQRELCLLCERDSLADISAG